MKSIIAMILLALSLQAATVIPNKTVYQPGEDVVIALSGVTGAYSNWVGIFPIGSPNVWDSTVDAIWFLRANDVTFNNLPGGEYEARLFYKDSFSLEATSKKFTVSAGQPTLKTDRTVYNNGDTIKATVSNVQGQANNFVAIFNQNDPSNWDTFMGKYSEWFQFRDGTVEFANNDLPYGNYQIRLFYNDDITKPKKVFNFSISNVKQGDIKTSKAEYNNKEALKITVSNVQGNNNNWVGIFRKGTASEWGNVLAENWLTVKNGTITIPQNFAGGDYEARLFYNDSLTVEKVASFKVKKVILPPTIYEDAENGNVAGWRTMEGPYTVKNIVRNGTRGIFGKASWVNGATYNRAFYQKLLDNGEYWNNTSQHILEMDISGSSACFQVGVEVRTTQGYRGMFFSIWFGKHGYPAMKAVYDGYTELAYPMPESYRFGHSWKHFRVDIAAKIKELEPDNELISIESFLLNGMSGGAVDNIKLSSE